MSSVLNPPRSPSARAPRRAVLVPVAVAVGAAGAGPDHRSGRPVHSAAQLAVVVVGVAAIVWGAEAFAEHLSVAAVRLRVSAFALAILLAGAEPEELATTVTASLRHAPAIAFGDVTGANIAICLRALGTCAALSQLPLGPSVL